MLKILLEIACAVSNHTPLLREKCLDEAAINVNSIIGSVANWIATFTSSIAKTTGRLQF